jgi:uncharacterized protein YcbK (DUF882 family)
MIPVLTFALALLSNTVDLARFLEVDEPGVLFTFGNRHEEGRFELFEEDGAVRPEALKAFSRFVRCWRTNKVKSMHPRTLEIVTAVSRHFGDARIDVVSGYRAAPYGAPHSKHFIGRAMDIRVEGVPAAVVAAWVWKNFRGVGVGYYPAQQFVHVDTRPDDVRWIDHAQSGESGSARYFGRPAGETLPGDAPVLAYDRRKAEPAVAAAANKGPLLMSALDGTANHRR